MENAKIEEYNERRNGLCLFGVKRVHFHIIDFFLLTFLLLDLVLVFIRQLQEHFIVLCLHRFQPYPFILSSYISLCLHNKSIRSWYHIYRQFILYILKENLLIRQIIYKIYRHYASLSLRNPYFIHMSILLLLLSLFL